MSPIWGLALLGARVLLLKKSTDTSTREDDAPGLSDADDAGDVAIFREALGVPYYWGGGRGEPYPSSGYDCSGYVDSALRAAGYTLPWAASSASTATMRAALGPPTPLAEGAEAPRGAILAYGSGSPSHVMLSTGAGAIGASGGGSSTRGDDPSAAVKEFPTARYRGDLLGYWLLT
jgi:cell wall-associated NlpC family hydrolase